MTAFGGALSDPTKIMGSRIGAYLVDSAIAIAIVVLWFLLIGSHGLNHVGGLSDARLFCAQHNRTVVDAPTGTGTDTTTPLADDEELCIAIGDTAYLMSNDDFNGVRAQMYVVAGGFSIVNHILLPALGGASLGKRLFGLRIVTANGQRAGLGRNLVRWLLLIVDAACCGIPGLLIATNSKGHRRLGDMAAGTYVVHRSAQGRLLHIPGHQVVRTHDEFGGWGPAPVKPELTVADGGGIDAPAWDPDRQTYVRYDKASGVWFQWDDATQAWIPAQT